MQRAARFLLWGGLALLVLSMASCGLPGACSQLAVQLRVKKRREKVSSHSELPACSPA